MKEIEKFIFREEVTIKQAMKIVSKARRGIALYVDKDNKLLGIITDSDIRKGVLEGYNLESPIGQIINKKPEVIRNGESKDNIKERLRKLKRRCMPVVSRDGKLLDLVFLDDYEKAYSRKKNKVIIMAGGQGSRLDPFTKILPKPLIPMGDKPIVEILMNKFDKYGFENFIISLNYKADMIKMYFENIKIPYNISYVNEAKISKSKKLGTIGSLGLMKKTLKETFIVVNCDTIINTDYEDLVEHHKEKENALTIVSSMQHIKIPFGILDINNGGELKEIQEKPEYNFLVNTGMYVLEPRVLNHIKKGQSLDMPDLIKTLQRNNEKIGTFPISQDDWFDTGQWDEYQHTLKKFEKFV